MENDKSGQQDIGFYSAKIGGGIFRQLSMCNVGERAKKLLILLIWQQSRVNNWFLGKLGAVLVVFWGTGDHEFGHGMGILAGKNRVWMMDGAMGGGGWIGFCRIPYFIFSLSSLSSSSSLFCCARNILPRPCLPHQ